MSVRLAAPGMTVLLDTGQSWHVTTGNPDLIAWDRTAAKHKWPSFRDAPFLWLTFLAWHASRRQGLLPDGLTFEQFEKRAAQIDADDDDDQAGDADQADDAEDGAGVGPTWPDPGSG